VTELERAELRRQIAGMDDRLFKLQRCNEKEKTGRP
jgi:hypothetical protein